MPRYRIYGVRFNSMDKDRKVIDKLLCTGSGSFAEIKDDFLRILYEANFSREKIEDIRKKLDKIPARKFIRFLADTENLHGQLGPGGYLLVKEEEP